MAKTSIALAALLSFLFAAPAPAQQAPASPPAQPQAQAPAPAAPPAPIPVAPLPPEITQAAKDLDDAAATLDGVEKRLDQHYLSDGTLVSMRDQITPLSAKLAAIIDKATPKLDDVKARLDQLGPAPDAKAAPESQTVSDERAALQQSAAGVDELIKRAKLLAVKTDQLKASIASRRRALFTTSLFRPSASLADPSLWRDVLPEAPKNLGRVGGVLSEWASYVNARLDGWRLVAFWLSLPAALVACAFLLRASRRILARRQTENPSELRKVVGAWWIALVIAVPPIALSLLMFFALDAGGFLTYRAKETFFALAAAIARVFIAAGLARGLFAPSRANWRLPRLNDAVASRLVGVIVGVAAIVAVTRLLEALNEVVDASLAFSVATRGVGALIGAAALATGLWRIGADASDEDCFGPPIARRFNWFVILRGVALFASLVVILAVLFGYPTFGSFVLDKGLWCAAVASLYFLLNALVDEGMSAGFKPDSRFAGSFVARVGVRRSSFALLGVIVSGVVRVILLIVAVVAVLAPLGLQSSDVPFDLRSAFFGFTVADITISPASILGGAAIFALALALAHMFTRWLDSKLLPQTQLDAGLRNSIVTSVNYLGFIVSAALALGYLGLSFERLAIVAGALSVGIGFGLQSIVNNFVSGLILLWERAVRVGDWIIVGGDQGFVRRINVRSTELETVDRTQVIIPNSSLISGVVKNLVRNDRSGRVTIPITVHGSADPSAVRETLFAIARADERVLRIPAPQIFFTGMSGSALNFELAAFIGDVETMARVRSDLHFEIFRHFKEKKFFDGPAAGPQQIEIVGAPGVLSRRADAGGVEAGAGG